MLIAMTFMPESPTWLIKKGRIFEATEALLFLHGNEGATNSEISQTPSIITDGLSTEEPPKKSIFIEFTKPHIYKPIFISLSLMFFQQFNGVNAILFYTTIIFQSSGSKSIDPLDATIIVGGVQVIGTFVACLLTDRAGRRMLLIISGAGCAVGLVILAVFYYLPEQSMASLGWLPIFALIVFIVSFSLGQGPIPWLIMGEIIPGHVKGAASGISASFNWLCAFIITKNFDAVIHLIGTVGIYSTFAFFAFLGCLFVFFFLPETKGKSLQEIENHFKS